MPKMPRKKWRENEKENRRNNNLVSSAAEDTVQHPLYQRLRNGCLFENDAIITADASEESKY
jgi:hypothetical protein